MRTIQLTREERYFDELKRDVEESLLYHERRMQPVVRALAEYRGPFYEAVSDGATTGHEVDNPRYELAQLLLPWLMHRQLAVDCNSKVRAFEQDAELMQQFFDHWLALTKPESDMRRAVFDSLWSYGVLLAQCEPKPGYVSGEVDPAGSEFDVQKGDKKRPRSDADVPWLPRSYQISMFRAGVYARAQTTRNARFQWWIQPRVQDDLVAEAEAHPERGWDVDAVKAMSTGGYTMTESGDVEALGRGEVAVLELYVPGMAARDQYGSSKHGAVVAMDAHGSHSVVRAKAPFWGPRGGPMTFIGLGEPGNRAYPLAPLCAGESAIRQMLRDARRLDRVLEQYRDFTVAAGRIADLVKTAKNGGIYTMDGIADIKSLIAKVQVGVDPDRFAAAADRSQYRMDRTLSAADSLRGMVNGRGTATENAIVDQRQNVRLDDMGGLVDEALCDHLRRIGYFAYTDDSVHVVLDVDEEQGTVDAFLGRYRDEPKYDSIELRLGVYSGERDTAERRRARAGERIDAVMALSNLPVWVDKRAVGRDIGKDIGYPELEERFNPELEAAMVAQGLTASSPQRPPTRVQAATGPNISISGFSSRNSRQGGSREAAGPQQKALLGARR